MSRRIRRIFSRKSRGAGKQYTFVKKRQGASPLFLNYLQESGFMRPIRRYSPPARWGKRIMIGLGILLLIGAIYVLVESIRALTLF